MATGWIGEPTPHVLRSVYAEFSGLSDGLRRLPYLLVGLAAILPAVYIILVQRMGSHIGQPIEIAKVRGWRGRRHLHGMRQRLNRWIGSSVDVPGSDADPDCSRQRIARGVISGLVTKAIGVLVTIVSVPLTLSYLGAERYGIWVMISTFLTWVSSVDLGLSIGLLPLLSEAYGTHRLDLARKYVSMAFWSLTAIALGLLACSLVLWPWVDWSWLFRARTLAAGELSSVLLLALGIFLLGFPVSIVQKIYLAFQRGDRGNAWLGLGNLASLIAILLVTRSEGGLRALVLGYLGTQTLVAWASALWLFGWEMPYLRPNVRFSPTVTRRMLGTGTAFFVSQLSALMVFHMDSIIIGRFLGPEQVTPYSVSWRLFSYVNLFQTMVGPYLWSAIGGAYARRDLAEVRRIFLGFLIASVTVGLTLLSMAVVFYESIILTWAGPSGLSCTSVVGWMAVWSAVNCVMHPMVLVLGSIGRVRHYAVYSTSGAILNVLLSIWWVGYFGPTGVIAASVLAYMPLTTIMAAMELRQVFRDRSTPVRAGDGDMNSLIEL